MCCVASLHAQAVCLFLLREMRRSRNERFVKFDFLTFKTLAALHYFFHASSAFSSPNLLAILV